MVKLPEEGLFADEIVDQLFPDLPAETRQKITGLFMHAFDHPWVDQEVQNSIVQNVCNEYGIDIPEKYAEEDYP